jgi:stage II sporulation protein D
MRRHYIFLDFLFLFCAGVFIFILYSCVKGPAYRDVYSLGEIIEPPKIRVGLSDFLEVSEFPVAVTGPYVITPVDASSILYEGKEPIQTTVQLVDSKGLQPGILFGTWRAPFSPIRVIPRNDGTLKIGKRFYHGDLLIYTSQQGLIAVNEVGLEQYLAGVLAAEMPLNSPEAALKSQIITARTYALYEIRTSILLRPHRMFDVYDDQRSQLYKGMEIEDAITVGLVRQVRGFVLSFGGRIFKSFYHSTCGGHTEPAWEVLGYPENITPLSGRSCGYCEGTRYSSWEIKASKKILANLLFREKYQGQLVTDIKILKRAPGGHVTWVNVYLEGQKEPLKLHANTEFRPKLRLRSTLFEIVDLGDEYLFAGRGFGHGVGLCQIGAITMAAKGTSYLNILRYYFPGADLTKLY